MTKQKISRTKLNEFKSDEKAEKHRLSFFWYVPKLTYISNTNLINFCNRDIFNLYINSPTNGNDSDFPNKKRASKKKEKVCGPNIL